MTRYSWRWWLKRTMRDRIVVCATDLLDRCVTDEIVDACGLKPGDTYRIVIDVRIDHDDMCSVATQRHNATPGVGG